MHFRNPVLIGRASEQSRPQKGHRRVPVISLDNIVTKMVQLKSIASQPKLCMGSMLRAFIVAKSQAKKNSIEKLSTDNDFL